MRRTAAIILAVFLVYGLQPQYVLAEANGLGYVSASGRAEVQVGKSWSSIERVHPATQTNYRTSAGRLSFALKDASRIEVGEQSQITLGGSEGGYSVELVNGKIAFSIPAESSFRLSTPDALIEVKALNNTARKTSYPGGNTVCGVYYYGKNTHVSVVSGKVSIKTLSGEGIMALKAGNAVVVSSTEAGYKIIPVQAIVKEDDDDDKAGFRLKSGGERVETLASAGAAGAGTAGGGVGGAGKAAVFGGLALGKGAAIGAAVGIAAMTGGVTAAEVIRKNREKDERKAVSPSSP